MSSLPEPIVLFPVVPQYDSTFEMILDYQEAGYAHFNFGAGCTFLNCRLVVYNKDKVAVCCGQHAESILGAIESAIRRMEQYEDKDSFNPVDLSNAKKILVDCEVQDFDTKLQWWNNRLVFKV